MVSETELALFSYSVYVQSDENSIAIPPIWERKDLSRVGSFGFAAAVFQNTQTGEYVIAFRGTDSVLADFIGGNVPAATGGLSPQVSQAIETIADVLHQAQGHPVVLTGHSLGGGLASIGAVFFDLPAVTFATAPFENSVRNGQPGEGPLPHLEHTVAEYYADYEAYALSRSPPYEVALGFSDYNLRVAGGFGDSEFLILLLVLVTLPFAADHPAPERTA